MPIAYIIHASEDTRFVAQQLVVPLRVLGLERWVSSRHLAGSAVATGQAIAASDTVLAIVSAWAARDTSVRGELDGAATAGRRIVPVQIDDTPVAEVSPVLESLVAVDLRRAAAHPLTSERIASALRPRLTVAGLPADAAVNQIAAPIAWDPKTCSALLARAVAEYDYGRAEELVARLATWLQQTSAPYDVEAARKDLGSLRRQRQFPLMQRYASAVRGSGIDDPNVIRQHAQALIELGQYGDAIGVLQRVVEQTGTGHAESYEARGLLGRAYKQMYVNAPGSDAAHLLMTAIGWYYDAFRENQQLTWHGI